MIYFHLFFGFLKISLFAFGGAYGAIPLIRDVVFSHGWLSDEMLTYMIAVSESTPGPIIINLATYIGSSKAGLLGAVAATLGVLIPCFVIIIIVTVLMKHVKKNKYIQAVLQGVKPCIIGIILATGSYMAISALIPNLSGTPFSIKSFVITIVLALIMFGTKPILKKKISPIMLIIISAILGMAIY